MTVILAGEESTKVQAASKRCQVLLVYGEISFQRTMCCPR